MVLPIHVFIYMLLNALRRFVRSTRCECVLLSGGVDTTVVALAARLEGAVSRGYTAYYIRGVPRDLPYADYALESYGSTTSRCL